MYTYKRIHILYYIYVFRVCLPAEGIPELRVILRILEKTCIELTNMLSKNNILTYKDLLHILQCNTSMCVHLVHTLSLFSSVAPSRAQSIILHYSKYTGKTNNIFRYKYLFFVQLGAYMIACSGQQAQD